MLQSLGPLGFARALLKILSGRPQVPPSLAENAALQTILQRRSVRTFRPDPIPDDVFAAILEAGRLAPSTVNLQTWSFAVFDPASWRETFGRSIPFHGRRAVVVLGDAHRGRALFESLPASPLVEYTVAVMNASLAAMNMNLAAETLGVASVMLSETGRTGLLDAGYLRERLGLPDGVFPLTTIVFGYPRGPRPPMPPKLPLESVSFIGRYREPDPATLRDWLQQMVAGYRASHPRSSFDAQLGVYAGKFGEAEGELRRLVFGDDGGGWHGRC